MSQIPTPKTRTLPITLTEEERLAKGIEHARLCQVIAEEEAEAKQDAKLRREAIKARKDEECHLREVVRSGKEDRPVEVREEADAPLGVIRTIRTDTGELVESRGMSERELVQYRQGKFFATLGEADDTAPQN